jgi:hypothetical protein
LDVWVNASANKPCGSVGDRYQAVGTLAAGATKKLTFTGLTAPGSDTPMPWTFRALVDSKCKTIETNDGNNQTSVSYGQCLATPDFVVFSAGISPATVKPGQQFTAYVLVGNIGLVPGNCGWVDVWANRSTPAHSGENGDAFQQAGGLNPWETRMLTFTGLTAGPAGPRNLLVFVDSTGATAERNETNNQFSVTYYPAQEVWDFRVMPELSHHFTSAEWSQLRNHFFRASNFLYDATDGQVRLGKIDFKDPNWDNPFEAWQLVLANFHVMPSARSFAVPFGVVMLGMDREQDHAYSTIVHELGHYKFLLGDEYTDLQSMIFNGAPNTRYCRSTQRSGSLMDIQYIAGVFEHGTSEFCTPSGPHSAHDPRALADGAPAATVQDLAWGTKSHFVSAWERIHSYNAAIAMPVGDPLPGPCSKSNDPNDPKSHEPMEANEGAATYTTINGP